MTHKKKQFFFFLFFPLFLMTIIDDIINLICSPAALGDAIAGWFGDKSSTANSQCHTLVLVSSYCFFLMLSWRGIPMC